MLTQRCGHTELKMAVSKNTEPKPLLLFLSQFLSVPSWSVWSVWKFFIHLSSMLILRLPSFSRVDFYIFFGEQIACLPAHCSCHSDHQIVRQLSEFLIVRAKIKIQMINFTAALEKHNSGQCDCWSRPGSSMIMICIFYRFIK